MPDFSAPGADRLKALDALASDVRSLLRRTARAQRQIADLSDPELTHSSRELLDATERLLALVEERRQQERQQTRRQLRGVANDQESV
jgi:sensor histidine kinase YesM